VEVGSDPMDRGKPGIKRHIVTDARGTPLGLTLSGANRHDSRMLALILDALPRVRSGGRGQPRRSECRSRGISLRIAQCGIESSQRLGKYWWVVERTFAWLNRFRRIAIRYKCRADIHLAFTTLACALVCINQIRRFY
jgi:transposase